MKKFVSVVLLAVVVLAACKSGHKATTAKSLATTAGAHSFKKTTPTPLLAKDAGAGLNPSMSVIVFSSKSRRDTWIATARKFGVSQPVIAGSNWVIQTDARNVGGIIHNVGGKVVVNPRH